MLEWLLAGLFGLLIGSFLNVCIYRWPRDLSVVRPAALGQCPECGNQIAGTTTFRLLSYVLAARRCRQCACPHSLAISGGGIAHRDQLCVFRT